MEISAQPAFILVMYDKEEAVVTEKCEAMLKREKPKCSRIKEPTF